MALQSASPIDDISVMIDTANDLALEVTNIVEMLMGCASPMPSSGPTEKVCDPISGMLPRLADRAAGAREHMLCAMRELSRLHAINTEPHIDHVGGSRLNTIAVR